LNVEVPAHLDPDTELSLTQFGTEIEWLSDRALREAAKAKPPRVRSRSKPGDRRGTRLLTPRRFLEDAERLPSCPAPGCEFPALADNGGCGQRGHGKAGRPRAPGVYMDATKTAAAKAGKLSLKRAAARFGCDRVVLRTRIERRDVLAERVGREYWIDPAEAERVEREFVCKADGCDRVALGETGYCGTKGGGHAGAASRRGVTRPTEERERISETKQRKEQEIAQRLRSIMKIEPVKTAAPTAMYSPHTLRGAGLRDRDGVPKKGRPPVVRVEWVTENGATVPRVGVDPLEFGRWFEHKFGSTAVYGKLASTRAVTKGTEMGRPHALTKSELKRVIELRAADPTAWSWSKLTAMVNEGRTADKQVSRTTVRRALS
jgi:hypothetical protein